jgi:hypothetical protein
MTSLNLASNRLYAEGAKIVAEAIKVTKGTPAIILVPFSCPSDFSINCCCLLLSAGYGGDDEPGSCVELSRIQGCQDCCGGHQGNKVYTCDHFGTISMYVHLTSQ